MRYVAPEPGKGIEAASAVSRPPARRGKEDRTPVYEWLLFGHLLGVALLLAGLGAHIVSVERLRRAETTSEVSALMSTAELGGRLVLVGGPLLVAAGLTMAVRSWSLTSGWIATAIALVIVQGILGSVVDHRMQAVRKALEAQSGETPTAELSALTTDPVIHAGNGVSVSVIAEILLLMSVKPGGWMIVWSIVGMAVLAGLAVWRALTPRTHSRGRATHG
jgi:hypothetical protein